MCHCKACDKTLNETEIVWNAEIGDWELCGTCLTIAMDAAYPGGIKDGSLTGDEDDDFQYVLFDDLEEYL